ncbi:MAG: MMPL family transporter, partial [Gammaproteobacteria bacterium]
MIENYAHWIIRWRYLVVLLVIAGVVAAGTGLPKLSMSNDYRMFFGEDNPQLLEFENMQNTFNKNDNIMFVVTPKDGKVFTVETLTAVQAITEEAWQIPYSTRVDSITNHQHTYAEEDDLIVDDLVVNPDELDESALAKIQQIAITEPMMVHRLISPDSQFTGINVTVQLPGKSLGEVPEAVTYARKIKSDILAKFPNIEIRLVGLAVMNNAFPEGSQADAKTLYPMALAFIIITLFILLRGYSGAVICFTMIIMSIIVAMGISGWLGTLLSPPVLSAPIMILTMAIANGVHLLVTMRHEMALGLDKIPSMVESMRVNFQPVFVTSLTT